MAQAFTEPLFAVPSRHELEDKAIILLREFYTIDEDIQIYREYAQGDNLPVEPRVTAFLRHDEDGQAAKKDMEILHEWRMKMETHAARDLLSEGEMKIARTISRYIKTSRVEYATFERIHRVVSRLAADTQDEQEIVDMFAVMLKESIGEQDDTRLNDIEMLVERRWKLIEEARRELNRLEKNKRYVGGALRQVKDKFPESYELLWLRYVEDQEVSRVCDLMNIPSDRIYQITRNQAMARLLERLPRLPELYCKPRKNGAKHKRGYPRAD